MTKFIDHLPRDDDGGPAVERSLLPVNFLRKTRRTRNMRKTARSIESWCFFSPPAELFMAETICNYLFCLRGEGDEFHADGRVVLSIFDGTCGLFFNTNDDDDEVILNNHGTTNEIVLFNILMYRRREWVSWWPAAPTLTRSTCRFSRTAIMGQTQQPSFGLSAAKEMIIIIKENATSRVLRIHYNSGNDARLRDGNDDDETLGVLNRNGK